MVEACRDRRGDIAALALGWLTPDEQTRVMAHVDGCAACRGDLADLMRAVRALPAADISRLDSEPAPPPDLAERITREVTLARRADQRRRRNRVAAAIAAVAAAVALIFGTITLVRDDKPAMSDFAQQAPGVEGHYALVANDQGTAVRLAYRGLGPNAVYWLWLTDATGRRVSAGTFRGADGNSVVTLQSALPTVDAVRIWITDASDIVLLDSRITH